MEIDYLFEVWKDIKGYEGLYQVSNLGRVKSLNYLRTGKEKIMSPGKQTSGYLHVTLVKNKIRKTISVHRLVAITFIPNPNNLPQVNHINECITDNRVENLEWVTEKENANWGTRIKRVTEKISKPVIQFNLDGNLIKEWPSGCEVERQLSFKQSVINRCCLGRNKTAYGFIWCYKEKEVA